MSFYTSDYNISNQESVVTITLIEAGTSINKGITLEVWMTVYVHGDGDCSLKVFATLYLLGEITLASRLH